MQSEYCKALTRAPGQPFFAGEVVRQSPYYQRTERAGKIGAWVATPGFLKNQIETLDAEWQSMGKEMFNSFIKMIDEQGAIKANQSKAGRFLSDVWTPMLSRWNIFVSDHTHWWDNLWGATWDNIKEQRNLLVQLRDKAEAAGFTFQTPTPLPPEKSPWDTISFLLKLIVGAVVGSLALYLLTQFIKFVQKQKQLVG